MAKEKSISVRLVALEKKHGFNSAQMARRLHIDYNTYMDKRNGRNKRTTPWQNIGLLAVEKFGISWLPSQKE